MGRNLEKCLKILGKKTTETIEKHTPVNISYPSVTFCILTCPFVLLQNPAHKEVTGLYLG